MWKKKVNFVFLLINIILLIFWFFVLKYWWFNKADNFAYSKLLALYYNSNRWTLWMSNIWNSLDPVLVKIDKKTFSKLWVTPSTFHRWYYAKLVKKLQSYGVKNIVFDVFFQKLHYWTWTSKLQKIYNKSLEIFDDRFANSLSWNVTLWVIPWYTYKENNLSSDYKVKTHTIPLIFPAKQFLGKWVDLWYVQSHLNNWPINNWIDPYVKYKSWYILNLWYAWYFNRLYAEWKIWKKINIIEKKTKNIFWANKLIIETTNKRYNKIIPLSTDYNWNSFVFTPLFVLHKSKLNYSMVDILNDQDNIYSPFFKNKTVFIWATDSTLNDMKLSYLWNIPWVMFHINSFLSIKNNQYIYLLWYKWSFVILLILFITWYLFVNFFKSESLSIIVFFVLLWLIYVSSIYILENNWILIPIGSLTIILTIKLFFDILNILLINEKRKELLNKLFNKYVWEKVLKKTDENKWWKIAEKKEIALMFSDIASFTNISEKLTAEEVIQMLNLYFEQTNKPIIKSHWFIDKYVWDAIMAFWENMESSDDILKAIIQIQKNHPKIMENVQNKLWKEIDIYTRIWLHYGEAIVWDVWDVNNKISYTAIGDNVNLASRLEWINKYYGTNIMLSETFYDKIEKKENFAIRLVDKITVKWKTEPINIYHTMPYYDFEITEELKDYLNKFEKWLDLYFKWEFEKSKDKFLELTIFKIWKEDPVLTMILKRLEYLIENKPKNWDWVWRFTTK